MRHKARQSDNNSKFWLIVGALFERGCLFEGRHNKRIYGIQARTQNLAALFKIFDEHPRGMSRLEAKLKRSIPSHLESLYRSPACIITCTYPLLAGGLIVFNTFEPQSIHDSGVQPSHHGHRHSYQAWIQQVISFGNPVLAVHWDIRTVMVLHFEEQKPWHIEYQCENPRAWNNHLKW